VLGSGFSREVIIMNKAISTIRDRQRNFIAPMVVLVAALLVLASCASPKVPPTSEINSAERAIQDAEQARVTEYALPELQEARAKLNTAREAVKEEKMETAKRLAQESSIYAELAVAKTELQKAQEVNDELEKNISVLKEEMNRNTGGQ
jgi:hypothetical protein